MTSFNCTVKDIFRRPCMIDKAVMDLAVNGYTEHAVTYSRIKDNLNNALEYAACNMRDYEYETAVIYLKTCESEKRIADTAYYTHRTIRRYVRKVCELIGRYYLEVMGIKLLPVDTRFVECNVPAGTFWEKANSLMESSIENVTVAIACCLEHKSINQACSTYHMGRDKVKRIIDSFGSVVTVYDIHSEGRSAV